MAELPELEILRRDADKELSGKKVKTVEVNVPAAVKRNTNKKVFSSKVEGHKIEGVSRVGTTLVAKLDSGEALCIVLGDNGRLLRTQTKDEVPKGVVASFTFTQHGGFRVVDPSKQAELFVIPQDEVAETVGLEGFDLADAPISWTTFGERLLRRQGKLKAILMDPSFLVGVGWMYSDEILFEAGLRYDRTPQSLSTQEIRRLYRATIEIIHEAMKHGGSTVGPDGWTDLFGKAGGYTPMLAVYGRDGQMSPRARGEVVKARFGNGTTYYCEQSQM
jgi:formamidopyrimidine-DNA glycosylase